MNPTYLHCGCTGCATGPTSSWVCVWAVSCLVTWDSVSCWGRRNECVVYFVFASYSVWAVLPRVRSVPALCLSSRCPVPSTLVREEQNGHATWSPLFIPAIACDERFWAGGGHLLFERGELPWLVCWDFLIRRVALLDAAQFSWWHHRLIVSLHTRMAGQQGSSVASGPDLLGRDCSSLSASSTMAPHMPPCWPAPPSDSQAATLLCPIPLPFALLGRQVFFLDLLPERAGLQEEGMLQPGRWLSARSVDVLTGWLTALSAGIDRSGDQVRVPIPGGGGGVQKGHFWA